MIKYQINNWSYFMRSFWILPVLLGFPLNILAEESAFGELNMASTLYLSSSQSYAIRKQHCELAGIFSRGNMVSKTIELNLEAKSQGASFHCGQNLEQNSIVIGVVGQIEQSTLDGVIVRYEDLTTDYQPYVAFQLSPSFSLGVGQELSNSERKTLNGNFSFSTHRLMLSGTWHQGPWEVTLAYADRYRDAMVSSADLPRSLALAARYSFSPLLTAGLIYSRIDYPGIASNGESEEMEHDLAAALTSRVSDVVSVELSYITEMNASGDKGGTSHIIGMLGQYQMDSETRIGGFVNQYKSIDDAFDTTMTAFGFNLTLSR